MVFLNSHRYTSVALLNLDVNEINKFYNTVQSYEDVNEIIFSLVWSVCLFL